ncbi:MAG: metalloregulator ArsR/SmtB family transcription factor [Anaerolineales bacterium]
MRARTLDNGYAAMAKLHKVLSHPVRLRILEMLAQCGEACVCHLTAALGRRQPYISQQLAILREAGLIAERRDGTLMYYRLTDERVMDLIAASRNWAAAKYGESVQFPSSEEGPLPGCSCPVCSKD